MKNIEKLPSGNYRVKKMLNGKSHSVTFDHKPTEKEVAKAISAIMETTHYSKVKTFEVCARKYIEMKKNVLSPASIREYSRKIGRLTDTFRYKPISSITQIDVQTEINQCALNCSPKTVRDLHGFISAVLNTFRPELSLRTTLPQKVKFEPKMPTENDIHRLLEAVKGTEFEIAFMLACLGLRRSEICALTKEDLNGNILTINKALVQNADKEYVLKTTKTTDSTRELYVPNELAELIRNCDTIYPYAPQSLHNALVRYQKQLGIPHFRLHDLRHYFVSYMHSKGMSDADIMASGGWKTDHVMKNVYRHALDESKTQAQKRYFDTMF